MVPPPGQSGSQPLPPKEQALFKKIVKYYEHKQYKNGLKLAKQILSNQKFSEHGETLAMKGLILNCMGKTEEARENVKKGLKNDLKSHVCWHVYGLLQRSEKKYDDAIKAYRNALRIDKENMQILRDLSLLQIQMRDLEGYRDTRYRLLTLRPTQRASWIGYAMAYHFLQDYEMALKILDDFRKTQNPTGYDFEYSELLLYQNMVLTESGDLERSLCHIKENESDIYDKLQVMESKADLCARLGKISEAVEIYRDLIRRNSENLAYYRNIESAMGLTDSDSQDDIIEKRLELYDDIRKIDPRASAPQRLPLRFLSGARFLERLKPYLLNGLRKCIPPLFNNIRNLYDDSTKVLVIEELMTRWAHWLEISGKLPDASESEPEETPTTLLWVYFFLAQHHDALGRYKTALEYVNKACLHTPTLIELSILKAKIYKHAGNKVEAVQWIKEAQSMDTADRYANSKCAKYMLRADLITEAEIMCGKFTREGSSPMQSLNEMQCMWFETECARAYKRIGKVGEALKKCHEVDRHFTVIVEDQFDFHTYCVRKMTLCAYVRLIRLEDRIKGHRFYYRAAKCAMKIYLRLHDKPDEAELGREGKKAEKLNASERRKLVRKMKKQAAKDQKQQKEKLQNAANVLKAQKPDPDGEPATADPVLDAESLLKTEHPLDEAVKFLMPLLHFNCQEIGAYTLGFEIFYRKGKVLRMLQCLKRGKDLNSDYPPLHLQSVKFLKFLASAKLDGPVREIVEEEVSKFFSCRDACQLNQEYIKSHTASCRHLLAGAQAIYFLDSSCQAEAVKMATGLPDSLSEDQWKVCHKVLKALLDDTLGQVEESLIQDYRNKCHVQFPLAYCFYLEAETEMNHNHVVGESKEETEDAGIAEE